MQTFDTPEPISVDLELAAANVHIEASDCAETTVEIGPTNASSAADNAAAEQSSVDFSRGRLRVTTPKTWKWPWWNSRGSVDVHISLPTHSRVHGSVAKATVHCTGRIGECDIKAASGKVHVEQSGRTSVTVASGDVNLGLVEGQAAVKTSNGDTAIREVTGDLRVTAANGNVNVDWPHGTVVAKSANGDIRIGNAERGSVVAETARGKIDVGIPYGVAVWLDLNTAFGRVNNELDATDAPDSSESSVDVKARTALGDITIRRAPTHDA